MVNKDIIGITVHRNFTRDGIYGRINFETECFSLSSQCVDRRLIGRHLVNTT